MSEWKKYRFPLNLQLFAEGDEDDDQGDDDQDDKKPPAKKNTKKPAEGGAPTWATQLQSTMENLATALKGTPEAAKGTQKVTVPPIKEPEQQQEEQQQQQQESQSSQEDKKGKSFLRWFLG